MSATPQVFHLITRLTSGGAVTTLTQLVTNLDGNDITVGHGAEFDQRCVDRLHEAGIETVQFPLMRHYNPITAVGAVGSISRYLKKHDFDIVHTHSTEAGIIGRASARLAGTPHVVHTIHGIPFTDDRNSALNWFVERCEIAVAPWTDSIVSIADVITEEYLARGIGKPEQYQTIHCGINVDRFQEASSADNLPGSGIRVLMVARLAKGKGFDVLLDGIESINSDDFSVLVAGDGPLHDELETEIQARGLADTVFLLGYRTDVPSVMAASDIFVLPSYREGTPLVIYEAMAAGLPVVATDIAGIPEQVDHGTTGYLVPSGDVDAFSSRLNELIVNTEKRNSYGKKGKRLSLEFSVDRMVEGYHQLYTNLLLDN